MSNTLKGMPDMPVPYRKKGFSAQQAYVMHLKSATYRV